MTTESTCIRIPSISECDTAALDLGLSDTIPNDNPSSFAQGGVFMGEHAPPYCYLEVAWMGTSLIFNANGANTGNCTTAEQCLCRAGKYHTQADGFIFCLNLNNCPYHEILIVPFNVLW